VPVPRGTQCFAVKNGVYVFGYRVAIRSSTKIQFKLNGHKLLSEQAAWTTGLHTSIVAMNDKEFFALAKRSNWREGDSTCMVFQMKYRTPAKIDTIKIMVNGFFLSLLDATNDHLYYIVEYPPPPDDCGPQGGSVYRMNLKDGSIDEIVKNISTEGADMTAIVPHLNLVFSDGTIKDYNINKYISSQNKTDVTAVFFSYEHNAFVNYRHSSDLSKWECFPLAPGGKMPAELRAVPCFHGGSKAK
jgi:hypothetical protein